MKNKYAWVTYRNWSLKALEGVLNTNDWKPGLLITTNDCVYDFSRFKKKGVPVLRIDPKKELKKGTLGYNALMDLSPQAIFYSGWSWIVPDELLKPISGISNLVLHPGMLPKDRGGSPIQNQMRAGRKSTYANLIELEKEVDAGPIYFKEKISLEGQADDVWARMTSAAITTAKKYLKAYAEGNLYPKPQVGTPKVHKRIKSKDSKLTPKIPSLQAERIVRAHNETDPNSYVTPAHINFQRGKLNIERASLSKPKGTREVLWKPDKIWSDLTLDELLLRLNNGDIVISFPDNQEGKLYLTRSHRV